MIRTNNLAMLRKGLPSPATTKSFFNLLLSCKNVFLHKFTRTSWRYYENQQERKIVLTSSKKAEKKSMWKLKKFGIWSSVEYSSDTICISPWRIFFQNFMKKSRVHHHILHTLFSLYNFIRAKNPISQKISRNVVKF